MPGASPLELVHLRRPSTDDLEAIRVRQLHQDVTYDGVGRLRSGWTPDGYHRFSLRRDFSAAPDAFDRAKGSIKSWSAQHGAGVLLQPVTPALEPGVVVALGIGTFGVWLSAACRVVEVVNTDRSFGFVYGTLPHHLAAGEESFMAHRGDDGMVYFEVEAFSRPASVLIRLAGPLGRVMQRRTASAYLDGMVAAAAA